MDATTQAFVTEIVSRKIAENWLYWLLFLASSFLAAFAGAYIKRRAENLATRDDFDELKRQLAENTRVTEEIKNELGHREWKTREVNALRRAKLEEFLIALSQATDGLSVFVRKSASGEFQDQEGEGIARLEMLANLYFPALRVSTLGFVQSCMSLTVWAIRRGREYRGVPVENTQERQRLHDESVATIGDRYPALLRQKTELEGLAAQEMARLLAIDIG